MSQSQYDLEEQDVWERYERGEIDSKQYHREMRDLEADFYGEAPFGGWKSSGVGPPEHGPGNVEFYTRLQAIYGGA